MTGYIAIVRVDNQNLVVTNANNVPRVFGNQHWAKKVAQVFAANSNIWIHTLEDFQKGNPTAPYGEIELTDDEGNTVLSDS